MFCKSYNSQQIVYYRYEEVGCNTCKSSPDSIFFGRNIAKFIEQVSETMHTALLASARVFMTLTHCHCFEHYCSLIMITVILQCREVVRLQEIRTFSYLFVKLKQITRVSITTRFLLVLNLSVTAVCCRLQGSKTRDRQILAGKVERRILGN